MFESAVSAPRPGSDAPRGPVGGAARGFVERVGAMAAELRATDPAGWDRRALVDGLGALGVLHGALSAVESALSAAVDALADQGADAAAVLRSVNHCSDREARRRQRRSAVLSDMPRVAAALADGELSVEGADHLVRAAERIDPALVDADDRLVAAVCSQPADRSRTTVDAWIHRHQSPRDADERLAVQRRNRSGSWWRDGRDGMRHYHFSLDPCTAAAVTQRFEAEYDRLWRSDGGRDGTPDEIRSPEQRRADVFTRLLGVAAPGPDTDPPLPEATKVGVQLVVAVDVGVLTGDDPDGRCEIVDTGPVPPSVLSELVPDATVRAALFDGPGRPLWLGRSRRLASLDQRLLLALRDRGCVGCAAPFGRTEAHHVVPFADGGTTDLDRLVSLCARCHGAVHSGHLELRRGADGTWETVPADRPTDRVRSRSPGHHRGRDPGPDPPVV